MVCRAILLKPHFHWVLLNQNSAIQIKREVSDVSTKYYHCSNLEFSQEFRGFHHIDASRITQVLITRNQCGA